MTLSEQDDKQNAAVKATVANLMAQGVAIGQATLNATIGDLFGVPVINGSAKASDALAAGIAIERLDTVATRTGDATDFQANAKLTNGATVAAKGSLAPVPKGYRVSLAQIDIAQGALQAHLVQPATVQVEGQSITVDELALDVGGGRVAVSGTAEVIRTVKPIRPYDYSGNFANGFMQVRIDVVNNSKLPWIEFQFELQEHLDEPSLFGDGLSFDQRKTDNGNISSTTFGRYSRDFEPYDRLLFTKGKVDFGERADFRFLISDYTPRWEFFLVQDPRIPSS